MLEEVTSQGTLNVLSVVAREQSHTVIPKTPVYDKTWNLTITHKLGC